jgi:two-component system nitrate/nitrite response regulator NarL
MNVAKPLKLASSKVTKVKILVADDHELLRDAIRKLLEKEADFEVVGTARNSRELLEHVGARKPDVLLLDMSLNRESGLDILRSLESSEVRVILLATSIETNHVTAALRLGARGVVMKDSASQLLYKAIRGVMSGEFWVERKSVGDLVRALRVAPTQVQETKSGNSHGLTRREMEILRAIVDGCTNKDIAQKFAISEQTVKHHLTNIFGKMGVSNRLELALAAMNRRLVLEE